MMPDYILITRAAIQSGNLRCHFDDNLLPYDCENVKTFDIGSKLRVYHTASEPEYPFFGLVNTQCLRELAEDGYKGADIFQRISRVIEGQTKTRIHLPRHWSEFHNDNLLSFFALPVETSRKRWVADHGFFGRGIRFDRLTDTGSSIDLFDHKPSDWPDDVEVAIERLNTLEVEEEASAGVKTGLAVSADFDVIGPNAVVKSQTYEAWLGDLKGKQSAILECPINEQIRISGPAGSGKTLTLCMRVLQTSRDKGVIARGQRILVATHSYALAETLDDILYTLNGNRRLDDNVIVWPLLPLLQGHTQVGQSLAEIIGADTLEGRKKSREAIQGLLSEKDLEDHPNLSKHISQALRASEASTERFELASNLYDEITGILFATGVAWDDDEAIQAYLLAERKDWMPPFYSLEDRSFVIGVYGRFLRQLLDEQAITSDQFVLDAIQVLQTFTWRMRRETEGYDYIFVDELQLFDPQERMALALLGRSRKGVPFITSEDPTQGVFSAVNNSYGHIDGASFFLADAHRFNLPIFELVHFMYRQFPLNVDPISTERPSKDDGGDGKKPMLFKQAATSAIDKVADLVFEAHRAADSDQRVCVATLGETHREIAEKLSSRGVPTEVIERSDDVERLTYSKRSVVIAPWQFLGGMQFSHVFVASEGVTSPTSSFAERRENISLYVACSRASETLAIVTSGYVPRLLGEALDHGYLQEGN